MTVQMTGQRMDSLYDLVVIGGGPAGMAAAAEARREGLQRVLIAERNRFLGGVLPQCLHDGFGLTEFRQSMTGPEYAQAWRTLVEQSDIRALTDTTAVRIEGDGPYTLWLTGPAVGLCKIITKSVVLSTGCRERSLGQMRIPGSRPAGIFTAGAAQFMMNCQNYLPGKSAVILGSGDIGLIMARRLTLEGVKVKMILGEQANGLLRNYVQCVRDFEIPIRFGYTVLSVHGYKRLKGVTVAPLDGDGRPDLTRSAYIPCDTLLVAAGLIPETELWSARGFSLDHMGGIPADPCGSTARNGIFACGNVVQIYDTVDEVSTRGKQAGRSAARWVQSGGASDGASDGAGGSDLPEYDLPVLSLGRKMTDEDADALFGARGKRSKTVYCVLCPKGGRMEVEKNGGGLSVSGAECEKGILYAQTEFTAPARTVTTTVKADGDGAPLIPVKTDRPVLLSEIRDVIGACRMIRVSPPVKAGDVIVSGIGGTKANLVATGGRI